MDLQEAIELIAFKLDSSSPQQWLDLGCGSGLFTLALASRLPPSSTIIAVDENGKSLQQIPAKFNEVRIKTLLADFINGDVEAKDIDGVLMANSFHYVKNKESLLNKLAPLLKKNASFLLVEYDRVTANAWVPYPLTMEAARELFQKFGYGNFKILGERPSVYGKHHMYAAIISG